MKKLIGILFLTIVCSMAVILTNCKKDTTSSSNNPSYMVGTWEGQYSGTDPNGGFVTTFTQVSTLKSNTYIDTLYGLPSNQSLQTTYQVSNGNWGIKSDVTDSIIKFEPTSSFRITQNSTSLSSFKQAPYSQNFSLGNSHSVMAELKDTTVGVTYSLNKIK